ncbi:MAG: hypothetical protein JWN94_3646 [Betaproteobacteria bacterium]|nr:hypothetical protein [Betaproteobacteria bacterium]
MRIGRFLAAASAALLLTMAFSAKAAMTPINVTWNPSTTGITTQGPFSFDNVVLNTFATIDVNSAGTGFTQQGFLNLSLFNQNGLPTSVPNVGYPSGSPYSLYISFTGTGTQTAGVPSTGQFTSLTYSLMGAPGVTTFTPNGSGMFSLNGNAGVALATGSLTSPGSTSLTVDAGTGLLLPAAQLTASFVPNPAFASFFVNPSASTPLTVTAAFTNTGTVVTSAPIAGGGTRLTLNGGGGNATLSQAAAVPEPDTYGMLLAGLGLVGFVARRKYKRHG